MTTRPLATSIRRIASLVSLTMTTRSLATSIRHIASLFSLAALLSATGCGAPVFPKALFTVEASSADYPVMLSKVPAKDPGRAIQAESGTHFAQSSQTYSTGYARVTVTHTEAGQSEMPASEKFAAKVRRSDKWVELESAQFMAEDYSGFSFTSADRNLVLEGKAHQ
jgi:hypothetical protein